MLTRPLARVTSLAAVFLIDSLLNLQKGKNPHFSKIDIECLSLFKLVSHKCLLTYGLYF